ncbi:23S rRNA (uracil-5-)-methyltransferase RumA, partial [bacterium]|nr:23S rRNA (uracil-5-)-methyltransferase RumA [bacterium]
GVQPELLIVDPPRPGLHKNVIRTILKSAPEKVVYISCNPTTQARDIGLLCHQYRIQLVQPVDMFPQTYHIENIVILNRA